VDNEAFWFIENPIFFIYMSLTLLRDELIFTEGNLSILRVSGLYGRQAVSINGKLSMLNVSCVYDEYVVDLDGKLYII